MSKERRRAGRGEELDIRDRRRFTADGDLIEGVEELDDADDVVDEPAGEAGIALPDTIPLEHFEAERQRAEEAERRAREYAEAYRKHRDEFEAVRARLERDQDSRVQSALGETFERLVSVLDDLDRALEFADESPLAQGMTMVAERLLAVLADAGLVPIDVVGETFDPAVADALAVVPVDDPERNNLVVEQVRRGWRFGDKILRPAQVHVGRAGASGEPAGASS